MLLGLLARLALATPCESPRDAAESLFHGAPCVVPADRAPSDAALLRAVLDARGLTLPMAALPDHDATDEDRVRPLPDSAPWLVLTRAPTGERWVVAPETLAEARSLHRESFTAVSRWFQEQLPSHASGPLGIHTWQLAYGLTLLLVGALGAWSARRWVLGRLLRTTRRLGIDLPDDLAGRLDRPLLLTTCAVLLAWSVRDLALSPVLATPMRVGALALAGVAGLVVLSRLIDLGGRVARQRASLSPSRFDDQMIPVAVQGSKVVAWVVGTLAILQFSGVEVWGFLAGVGIGSLAVALAAQDSLANLFGALNIFLDRPFQVGDWIRVGPVEGTVEEIGFRSVRVRTFHNSLVTIPNSRITSTEVDNLGARERRRVKLVLGIVYGTAPEQLERFLVDLRALLAATPEVDPAFEVHFDGFGPSALDVLVYFHLHVDTWTAELDTRDRVFLAILRLAEDLAIGFAFPTTTVHVASLPRRRAPAPTPFGRSRERARRACRTKPDRRSARACARTPE